MNKFLEFNYFLQGCVDNFKKGEYFYTPCDNSTSNNAIQCKNGKCFNSTFFLNESTICDQPANYSNGQ